MKLSKKFLAVAMSASVVASVAAAGTLAYLTGEDTAVNTFTVGKVAINLDEAKVGPDGKALTGADAERVKENEYKNIVPGATLDKDPTVTVEADSADCYVYVAVRNYLASDELNPVEYAYYLFNEDTWDYSYFVPYAPTNDDICRIDIFRYKGSLADENGIIKSSEEDIVLEPVFADGKMYVENFLTAEKAKDMLGDKIVVKAFAVQADNLETENGKTGLEAANKMASDYFIHEAKWK